MTDYQDIFIENLKFYRKQTHTSQEKLAEKCDCATATIGCIEIGRQAPSFEMIVKIANALEINPADLFLRDASKSQNELKTALKTFFENDIPKLAEEKFSISIFPKNINQ
ncbi:MAG: helix-turn-helix domain-containing protein [Treponemataceae bacterium]|nr:helix-turn-helix domain-containing protein [Treponemataceae bacterium]